MTKLRQKMGIFGFWSLGLAVSAVACGSSFDSEDCRASRTCAQAGAGMGGGGAPPSSAGAPAGGDDTGQPAEDGGASGSPTTPETAGAGAGGEGGAAVVAVNPPPTVISVSPADAAGSVEPNAVVKITFSEPLADESVNEASVQLLHRGKEIEGTPTHAGSVVTFRPKRPLGLLGEYEVAVTTGVTDAEGAPLAEPFKSTFVVRDGKFSVVNAVDHDVQYLAAHVPVEATGSVLLAWTDRSGGADCPVRYQRFLRGEPVGDAESLSKTEPIEEAAAACGLLTAAASPAGISAVAWAEFSGAPQTGHVRQFRDGVWSPDEVPTIGDAGNALSLGLAPDGGVSLLQNVTARTWAYRTDADGVWSKTRDNLGATGDVSSDTTVKFDEAGNGLAVWSASVSDVEHVYSSRFQKDSGKWSPAVIIPGSKEALPAEGYERGTPALAMDPQGNAVSLWVAVDGPSSTPTLMFSVFVHDGSTWSNAKKVANSVGGEALVDAPALVFDGNTFVAAFTAEQSGKLYTFVSRFDLTAWSAPERQQAQQDETSSERMPKLVTDGRGNLLLVYASGYSPTYALYYQRYTEDAWSPIKLIDQAPSSLFPWSLSSNEDGLAALAWTEDDGFGSSTKKVQLASFY